jgi:SAM-dependent methyltransferase
MSEFRIHHPNCDLCGGQDFEPVAHRDRRKAPLRTVICRSCGLVRHWRVPTEEELSRFYGSEYRRAYHGEYQPSDRRIMRAWRKAERVHGGLKPHLNGVRRVFEIGAGTGCTVKYFERQGYEAAGIEPNQGFQEFAVSALRARIRQGTVQQCPPARNDLVLLIHVIEHLRSPREVLGMIRRLLANDGLLYVECPDLGANFTRRSKMFHFAHIHNFNAHTLSQLLGSCGFEIVSWISPGDEPNLCLLARAGTDTDVPQAGPSLKPDGYQEAIAALNRYNTLSYHLRRDYLMARARKLGAYAEERYAAHAFVTKLLASCREDTPVCFPAPV